jgi:predicted alpha/beta superfamily hydrolase
MAPPFKLASPETGTEYWLLVETPATAGGTGPWPVLLFLDGDDQFAAGVAAYRSLEAGAGVPPLLLAGVGYGGGYRSKANRRGRDYTPTHHADEPSSGGAAAFLSFLSGTLWPELARRYPVDPATRGLAGHSLGSLLVLFALFQPRPFFTHHLASAPSIWWDDRSVLRQVTELRARQQSLPARLFLSAGAEDSTSMSADLALLEAQLRAKPFAGLDVTARRFPGLNHYNVLPTAFAAGISTLFGPARVSSSSPKPARRPPRPRQ